jgi:cytochrome P450
MSEASPQPTLLAQDSDVHFDPFAPAVHRDPYPTYKRLRDEAPVYHNEERGFWAVSRYDDVVAVSRDWRRFTTTRGVDIDNYGDVLGGGFFLAKDPPEHGQLRDVVKAAFGLRTVRERTEEPIRAVVEQLVSDIAEQESADLAADLAWELPARAMSILLGFPEEDCDRLRELGLQLMARNIGEPAPPAASDEAGMALMEYFIEQVESRQREPRADLLSEIATATVAGEPIGDSAPGMALLLHVGGFENVGCSISNALYWLARHADQRAWLAANPAGIPVAVEELLRFDPAQQNFKRTTTGDVELHGVEIPIGSPVIMLYGAAARDERHFDNPDTFDVQRAGERHLSFGDGIHHCLGAPLARLELQIVLETVLRTMPDYELSGSPERVASHAVRGFMKLPATIT